MKKRKTIKADRRYIYAFLRLGAFFAAGIIGGQYYTVLYALLLLLPIGYIYVCVAKINFSINTNFELNGKIKDEHELVCDRGSEFQYVIECSTKLLPCPVYLEYSFRADIVLKENFCSPKATEIIELAAPHRGEYFIEITDVFFSDLFNVVQVPLKSIKQKRKIVALPKLLPLPFAIQRELSNLNERFGDVTDSFSDDVREYRYGDSNKRIHWNLSSRGQGFLVREYEYLQEKEIVCILDTKYLENILIDAAVCQDKLIEACLSVLNHKMGSVVKYYNGENLIVKRIKNTSDIEDLRREFALLEFTPGAILPKTNDDKTLVFLFSAEEKADMGYGLDASQKFSFYRKDSYGNVEYLGDLC